MNRINRYLTAASFLLIATPAAFARDQSMLARVTVYWASGGSGSDSWTRKHIAASGAHLRDGHCAVDPRRIPYGSKVILPDATLIAVDTGSSVRSRKAARLCGRSSCEREAIVIDRFFETKDQALSWANHNPQFMTVRVLSPNELSIAAETVPTRGGTTRTTQVVTKTSIARNSIVRTTVGNLTTSRGVVSTPMPQAAALRGKPALKAPPQKLIAQNTARPPSHYGRAVAYLP